MHALHHHHGCWVDLASPLLDPAWRPLDLEAGEVEEPSAVEDDASEVEEAGAVEDNGARWRRPVQSPE